MVGKTLSHYKIVSELGRGGMGIVYKAEDSKLHRTVAIKVLPAAALANEDDRTRFYREARAAASLSHPHIATVYEIDEAVPEGAKDDDLRPFIAMEFIEGETLHDRIQQGPLKIKEAVRIGREIASALEAAHEKGIVHRDIKPANILYSLRDDRLKISDFGVARITNNNRTKTGIVLGTPMYMSPEQLNAEELTGHSDLFSLGVTLYELLVGEVPFKASNIAVLMTRITTEDPAPVSNRRPGVPPAVDAVLFKALAKRPEQRFANGGEMAIALRNCARYI